MASENVPKLRFKGFNGEWNNSKLGDIITLMQSGLSRKLSVEDIGVPVLRSNNIVNGHIDLTDIKYWYLNDTQGAKIENYFLIKNDLLVNFINSLHKMGKSAVYNDELKRPAIFTTNLMRLNFKNNIDPYFIYYFFNTSYYKYYIDKITKPAVNQASFTTVDFKKMELKIPNINEQKRISQFFKCIDKKIKLLEDKHRKYVDFKKYLMQQIFTQKLRFKYSDDWKICKLKDICNIQDGTHSTPNYVDEGVPFYSVETITNNVPPKFISKEEHEKLIKRCKPQLGDILITRIGTLAKSKVVDWNDEFSIYVSLALLSSIKINSDYLNLYIQTEDFQKEFLKRSLLLAVPQKINLKDLKELKIKYPSFEEQKNIVNLFKPVDSKLFNIKSELLMMKNFKQGLLQQMFV